MQLKQLQQLQIKYETADIIPAPYCNQILLSLEQKTEGLSADFQIVYTYRDDLTEEDLYDEGFTSEDDFSWKGILNKAWRTAIEQLLAKTPERPNHKALEEEENFLEISVGKNFEGRPQNQAEWEYLLQELMQAVYETAQKEKNLSLIYKKIDRDKNVQTLFIDVFFSTRKAEAYTGTGSGKTLKQFVWEDATPLMQQVFVGEFIPELASQNEPKNPGKYLTTGDGFWYEFSKSLKNPNGNKKYTVTLLDYFDELLK